MGDYIVGIDVGSSKVCSAIGKLDKNGKLQISGITSLNCDGLKKGIVVNIDSTSEAIKGCIEQLERMVDTQISSAYISLSGGISELITSRGIIAVSSDDRDISGNDVERVLKSARNIAIASDKEIIGVIPKQYTVDGYDNIKEPVGMSGLRLEVEAQVVVAQSTIVNNLFKSVNKAGLKVKGIVLEPLAASEVVLRKEETEIGTVLLDVGADTIDLSLFKGGYLQYVDRIALGGNSITNDISVCLKIPFSEAEKLKIKYSSLEQTAEKNKEKVKVNDAFNNVIEVNYSTLSEIIEARIEEILLLVNKKLRASGLSDDISGYVIVGGGIANIRGICDYSKNILKKPVRIGVPEYVGAASPMYATALGIVKDVVNNIQNEVTRNEYVEEQVVNKKVPKQARNNNKDENKIMSKMKEFFSDFF